MPTEQPDYASLFKRARELRIEDELARRGIKLRRKGGELVGPDPKTGEGDDRFAVNPAKQLWNCRGTGQGGDIIDLVMYIDGSNVIDACRTLTGEPPPLMNGAQHGSTAKEPSRHSTATADKQVAVAEYQYEDDDGTVLYRKLRINLRKPDGSWVLDKGGSKRAKEFRLQRPGGRDRWIDGIEGIKRIPYRLPQLIEAVANGQTVFVVEGEGKVDALAAINIVATCGPDGSSKWRDELSGHFRGAEVVVMPDNDEVGRKYSEKVVEALKDVAQRVRVLDLGALWKECPPAGDVADFIKADGTADDIWEAVEKRAPTGAEWLKGRGPKGGDDKPKPQPEQQPNPEPKPEPPPEGLIAQADTKPHDWPDLGRGGKPSPTCTNARAAIEALGIDCRYDVFHDRKLVGGYVIAQWAGELSDDAIQALRVIIKEKFGFDPGKDHTHDAAVQLCLQHRFDPVSDYFDGLKWDGVARLDKWLTNYLGAEDTALNEAIARLSLVAAVRRVRQPGCKFDQIIVLEGPEGTGKSTAIEILAGPENFSDQTIIGLDDRQQQEAVRGVLLYEIADLAGMSKTDVDRTKAFASRRADRARPAYGRHRVELLRRCVFFATTNNETYLKSQTGNRRFWPVKTGKINLDALRRDRGQLWAEAAHIEASGASLKLPEALWTDAATEQDKRRDPDPWDDMLSSAKGTVVDVCEPSGTYQEERISTADLLTVHLKMPPDKATDATTKRLSFCMTRLGWTKAENPMRFGDGKQQRGYVRRVLRARNCPQRVPVTG